MSSKGLKNARFEQIDQCLRQVVPLVSAAGSFCNICKLLALPSMQAIARMANFPQRLLPVALLPIVIATFITAEQSWQSGANLEHYISSAPSLATKKGQAGLSSSSLAGTMEISASHTAPSVDVVGTQVVREPSDHEQEFHHSGGLKWVDSNNGERFAMMGLEDAEEEKGQRAQEKPAGNVSTDGESVLVVTINITGFMTPTNGPNRMDALHQTESRVVYRSITNWFPKMRLTSEETIARCTVELPMKVLSLALAQLMKKGTTPSQIVNPQYQHQHLHNNFRRNRRCG
ncbi:PREDICTED: uncharacterized protein LOC109480886 [Branchiostoma belcheri]|uniref:Uncharacterized protein LOC109480886 n=1 Tax=Branchiostoma belcheri TaxID=7741 RepID=A0A6P4ZXK4_BRABE|nr:PREDICTED: uncharacterized protein LOC109480886 [Branchiostoma belcheri]